MCVDIYILWIYCQDTGNTWKRIRRKKVLHTGSLKWNRQLPLVDRLCVCDAADDTKQWLHLLILDSRQARPSGFFLLFFLAASPSIPPKFIYLCIYIFIYIYLYFYVYTVKYRSGKHVEHTRTRRQRWEVPFGVGVGGGGVELGMRGCVKGQRSREHGSTRLQFTTLLRSMQQGMEVRYSP